MKKVLVLAAVLAILPAIASAAVTFTCSSGNYNGKLTSISKDLNGKTGTLVVTKEGDKCVMKFKTEGSNEVWEVSGNTLVQKEFDNAGKVTQQYAATASGDKYVINCKDKAKNDCDSGIDSRNYWKINTTPTTVDYMVYGVGDANKSNPTATVAERHKFSFTKAQ